MAIYIVTNVGKIAAKHSDCRCIDRIEATEYRWNRQIVLSPAEAYVMVSRGIDRLWAKARNGLIPVLPVNEEGVRYVRTEPTDTPNDVLMKQAEIS
jgi:hypothetical protein